MASSNLLLAPRIAGAILLTLPGSDMVNLTLAYGLRDGFNYVLLTELN
jgi:hypothetical protein